MTVMTERGEMEAQAKVTNRIRPMQIGGRTVHQISMPWHWGTLTHLRAGRHGRLAQRPGGAVGRPEHLDRGQDVLVQRQGRSPRAADDGAALRTRRSVRSRADEEHEAEQPDKL